MPNDSVEPLIGVINAGSSSLKFSFYEGGTRLLSGQVDGIGVHPAARTVGLEGKAIAPPDFAGNPPSSPSEVLPAICPGRASIWVIGVSRRSATASSTAARDTRSRRG